MLPREFHYVSLLRRELQEWWAPIACRRQEIRPSIPGPPVGLVNNPYDWPFSGSFDFDRINLAPLYLPSPRTGKRPCSSGFIPLLCVSWFTPLHFARPPMCSSGFIPLLSVFGFAGCLVLGLRGRGFSSSASMAHTSTNPLQRNPPGESDHGHEFLPAPRRIHSCAALFLLCPA